MNMNTAGESTSKVNTAGESTSCQTSKVRLRFLGHVAGLLDRKHSRKLQVRHVEPDVTNQGRKSRSFKDSSTRGLRVNVLGLGGLTVSVGARFIQKFPLPIVGEPSMSPCRRTRRTS